MKRKLILQIIDKAARGGVEKLNLHGRNMTELPSEIGRLVALKTLLIHDNQLTSLPDAIGQLNNLQTLDLDNNQLTSLPDAIGQLNKMQILLLNNSRLRSLPDTIGQLKNLRILDASNNQLASLPDTIGQLKNLQTLDLNNNQLASLPHAIGQLNNLQRLHVEDNKLTSLPDTIGQLNGLERFHIHNNQLTSLPNTIGQLNNLQRLLLHNNQLTSLPGAIGQLNNPQTLDLHNNQLTSLPDAIGKLSNLQGLLLNNNQLTSLPDVIGQLSSLQRLLLNDNQLTSLPDAIGKLNNLQILELDNNQLTSLPDTIGKLNNLQRLHLNNNELTSLPAGYARLGRVKVRGLSSNPLDPGLRTAYESGRSALHAYLMSLVETARREELYEAKLLLVGEGGVGKTTLLKAMTGQQPQEGEPTTHGVNIDIQSLHVPHPGKEGIEIRLNAWDFGGQEVYRVTHQFFFSRRSIYLLLWEPRGGVQQCQVEDWLKLIRLRVGDDASVIIVSTHCRTSERIARIDKPVLQRDFGTMIVGFHEVDSLVDDPETGQKVGIAALRDLIAATAKDLQQMGMVFNRDWREARDELLDLPAPRITYQEFAAVCERHGLDAMATRTLAVLMHDLGYVVHYGDDERLRDDIVLQPEWLTKAIGFVLEDRTTQEMDGILPDARLKEVWWGHPFKGETKYPPDLYPFFLRLMEKYDVSYRLEQGDASLVAQHVPQVRPDLPWLPEEEPAPGARRIAMVCVMEEAPPGLVPWMIVRTHDYAYEQTDATGAAHRLHWQKGMFLRNRNHGEAMLELRGREFHLHAEALWPGFFLNKLQRTLHKLITDNWPGMKGRYYFAVPCRETVNGKPCDGRFNIEALRQFLEEGDDTIRCQDCRQRQKIVELLFGLEEEEESREQLARIETKLDLGFEVVRQELEGLESRLANYVMAIMQAISSESKEGPRLFTIEPVDGRWDLVKKTYRLRLWCEAEGCQHPVAEAGFGVYEIEETRDWVRRVAPYANLIAGVLRTVLPVAAPAANLLFDSEVMDQVKLKDHLAIVKEMTGKLLEGELRVDEPLRPREGLLSEPERSGVLALHALLRREDPTRERLGLKRIPTYTGDFLWLCKTHYQLAQPKIPDRIE